MTHEDDWRIRNQENYLTGVQVKFLPYRQYAKDLDWDHDHCEFCWAKFMIDGIHDTLSEGYVTREDCHWICQNCYEDFHERFKLEVVEEYWGNKDS